MQKRARIILLTVFIALFFILAPQIILYSLGYRFDFEEKKFVNTGGLYLKIQPQKAEIFIDVKFAGKTGILSNSILIQNLLPKKHEILIKKEGYHPWKKTLEIKEKEVTKAENIILIKKNPVFSILKNNVDNFPLLLGTKNSEKNKEKNKKELPPLNNLVAYEFSGNNIIWLADSGFLYKSNSSGKIVESFNLKPFPVKEGNLYEIIIYPETIFLKESPSPGSGASSEATLFLVNPSLKVFEKFYSPVRNIVLSPDSKKIFYLNDYEIWLSYLPPHQTIKGKITLEKIFLTRFSEKISNYFWLNSHYLIFNVGDKIKISEIDNRDRINIVDLAEFKNPKIFWDQDKKKLYVLSENTLFVSEELIP